MEQEFFDKISDYPYVHLGVFYDSRDLPQNKTCIEKCESKDCLGILDQASPVSYVCSKGYNNVPIVIGDFRIILNGLIFYDNKAVPKGRMEVRKKWVIDEEKVRAFVEKVENIGSYLTQKENDTTVKNFSIFHDFKTSMSIFFSCTQEIINGLPGNSFEDKLDNAETEYQDLYRAMNLVTSQLRMIDIVINPSSIIFGSKKIINIYRLFDKMKMLFEHLAIRKRDISIKFLPCPRIPDSLCYESIEFIPLILLDNALKYTVPDSDIEVKMEKHFDKITVIVKNIGPLVSDENAEKIFDKFYRDESARKFNKDGIGVGLWMAQNILEAHGSKLYYRKNPNDAGKSIGLNIFTFDLSIYQPMG